MNWYFKKSLILGVITIILFILIMSFHGYPYNSLLLAIVLTVIFLAIPNVVFLLLLCWLNTKYKIYFTFPLMIFEVLLLYGVNFMIHRVINSIPVEYRFEKTPTSYGIRSWLISPYIEVYQYLILFLILYLLRDFFVKNFDLMKYFK